MTEIEVIDYIKNNRKFILSMIDDNRQSAANRTMDEAIRCFNYCWCGFEEPDNFRMRIILEIESGHFPTSLSWHRENKPAVSYIKDTNFRNYGYVNGTTEYWLHDARHNRYGAAIVSDNTSDWYIHGSYLNPERLDKLLNEYGLDSKCIKPEDKIILDLIPDEKFNKCRI